MEVFTHRGINLGPEQTLQAFKKAFDGAFNVEFDGYIIPRSTDNSEPVPVAFHDKTVDRTTNGTGLLKQYNLVDLKKLDAGSKFGAEHKGARVPTVEEVFDLTRNYMNAKVDIDLKDPIGGIILKIVEEKGLLDRTIFTSFNLNIITDILAHNRHTKVGLIVQDDTITQRNIRTLADKGISTVIMQFNTVSPRAIELCHRAGLKAGAWADITDGRERGNAPDLPVDMIIDNDPIDLTSRINIRNKKRATPITPFYNKKAA